MGAGALAFRAQPTARLRVECLDCLECLEWLEALSAGQCECALHFGVGFSLGFVAVCCWQGNGRARRCRKYRPASAARKKKNKLRLDSRDADRSRKRKKETICKSRQECGSSRQRSPSSSSWLSRAVDCDHRYGTIKLVALPIRFAFPPPATPGIAFIDPRRSSTGASPPTCNIDLHSRSAAPAMRRPTSTQVAFWRSAHPISSRQPPGDHACPDARPA